MNNAGVIGIVADAPLLGDAALQEAFAELREVHAGWSENGGPSGAGQSQAGQPPKTLAQVLGEITWLMTQSRRHKSIPLGDLEWRVMPAILLRQFWMFYHDGQPIAVALWALVDDLVAQRIDAGDKRLTAVEWKSGTNTRIIDIIAPFGREAEMRSNVGDI
jgi:cytolysin-activating lysine-acyltransferase